MTKYRFNIIEYLYYRSTLLYNKIERRSGSEDNKLTGAWVVSTCISINFITLALPLTYLWLGAQMTNTKSADYNFVVIIALAIYFVINVLTLIHLAKNHHQRIFEKYRNETPRQKAGRIRLLIIYIFLTFALLLVVAVFGKDIIDSII
jgi:uncharacterized membrane protein